MVASHRTAERVGLGKTIILMGYLEQLNKHYSYSDSISDYDLSRKLDILKRDIRRDWQSYKRERSILHGEEVKDNGLDMLIVFLIKRGFMK